MDVNANSHCPYRQSKNLLDALSSDKTKIGFFIGAGCPASIPHPDGGEESLVPAIQGLTRLVRERLSESEAHKDSIAAVLKRFQDGAGVEPTIEEILSHIRALIDVVRNGTIDGLNKASLVELDKAICDITTEVVNAQLPGTNTPYHMLARWIRSIARPQPVELFTSNYDLLLEQALEAESVPYFDGFVGSNEAFFDLTSMEEESGSAEKSLPIRWSRL